MPATRVPWIRLDVDADQSDKVQSLPSGDARWAWVRMMLRAKTARRMGVFASRRALAEMLGPQGRHVADLVRVGLAHDVPTGCDRCTTAYFDACPGEVVVHDFRKEQRDPTAADRKAEERAASSRVGHADVTLMSRGSHGQTGPDVTAMSRHGHSDVTADSRARGMTVTVTETRDVDRAPYTPSSRAQKAGRGPSADGMTTARLTREQAAAWRSLGPEWDGFRDAWVARGYRLPPTGDGGDADGEHQSQRRLLWTIVDEWPGSVGAWVREAPQGASPRQVIEHVLTRYHAAIAERQALADAEEARWDADKAAERQGAGRVLEDLDFGGEAA